MRSVIGAAIAAGMVSLFVPSAGAAPADAPGSFCARVHPGEVAGEIADPALDELSGLVASRRHPGVLWAHNDSGATAEVFAVSDTGAALGTYDLPGAQNIDWEDIAVGPGPDAGVSYLYVGDIGGNAVERPEVVVYRVPEPTDAPDGTGGTLSGVEPLTLRFPDGPADSEALFVDPLNGDLYLITKSFSGASTVLRAAAAALSAGSVTDLEAVAELQLADTGPYDPAFPFALPSTMVTAADISPDGSTILVRSYQQVLAFSRAPGVSVGEAMVGPPCAAPQVAEVQGEAIAFSADGDSYFTSTEVQLPIELGALPAGTLAALVRFAIDPPVEATPPTTTPSTPSTTSPSTTAPPTSAVPTTGVPATAPPVAPSTAAPSVSAAGESGVDSGAGTAVLIGVVVVIVAGAAWGALSVHRRNRSRSRP